VGGRFFPARGLLMSLVLRAIAFHLQPSTINHYTTGGLSKHEKVALEVCESMINFDLLIKIPKDVEDMNTEISEYQSKLIGQGEDRFDLDGCIIDGYNADAAIGKLLEKFFAYGGTRDPPPSFYQIWDLLSFADLVAPDWKEYLKNNKNKKDIYEDFLWWTKDWPTLWNKKCGRKELKIDVELFQENRAKYLQDGWKWWEWCKSLSNGKTCINHRGILLLLMAAKSATNYDTKVLDNRAFDLALEYITRAVLGVQEVAKILNPWALRLYTDMLGPGWLEELEDDFCGVSPTVSGYASKEESDSTMAEAEV
jgi:hypothetical protein